MGLRSPHSLPPPPPHPSGDTCHLSGGKKVARRTEVRIACSPDSRVHMLIREPDYCSYVFVLYVPQLCVVEGFQPEAKEAEGGGRGGGGATAAD